MSESPGGVSSTNESLTQGAQMRRRGRRTIGTGVAVTIAVVLLAAGLGGGYLLGSNYGSSSKAGAQSYTITETGSTLIFPYMNLLGPAYSGLYPNIQVSPQGTGSGTGISSAESNITDIGGTDAYLLPATAAKYSLINVPVAISAQLAVYNIPGITTHLNQNGTVFAMIYSEAITYWTDPLIQAANPGVALPHQQILPIHRSDGSGDTFMWTSFMYMSWKGWAGGYGTTYSWKSDQKGYQGNAGMVSGLGGTNCQGGTPYGLAYIGISYLSDIQADSCLQYAALGDQAANVNGTNPANYVLPTAQTISQDANLALQNLQPPSVAISLILGGVPGATNLVLGGGGTMPTAQYPQPYPDTNLEYLLISTHPANPSKQTWVVNFLQWALTYGQSYTTQVNFLPLTAEVVGYDMQALSAVQVSS